MESDHGLQRRIARLYELLCDETRGHAAAQSSFACGTDKRLKGWAGLERYASLQFAVVEAADAVAEVADDFCLRAFRLVS